MPKDEYSSLRRAYAAAMGVTSRTAQRHQKDDHPDWARFLGKTAGDALKRGAIEPAAATALAAVSPSRPEERPAFYDHADDGLSVEQLEEKRAWEIHDRTFRTWQDMMGDMRTEAVVSLAFARELPKLRENYEKAKSARVRWEVEQRLMIPAHEFEGFVGKFVVPLAEMLKSLPSELAVLVNPDNPGVARERLMEWLRSKMEPAIQGMLKGAEEFA